MNDFWQLHQPAIPIFLHLLRPSYSLRQQRWNYTISNPTMASKCSSERKSPKSFILNQKLKMIKLSEESMHQDGSKARRLTPNSQVVNAKEIKNAIQWIRKRNSLCADMEKIWMVCKENLARHNIPLKPIPNPEPGPNSPQFSECWEWWAGCRRKVWRQQRLRGRSCLHSIKVQGEGAGADVEAAVTYPEGPHRIINKWLC